MWPRDKYMKSVLSFFSVIFFSGYAFAQGQSSAEVTCRAQAKEAAVQTYSSCITMARTTQVDEIRKNYQKELADLKLKYDAELKKMGGGKKASKQAAVKVKDSAKPRATKGVAKELPSKELTVAEVAPVQVVSDEAKVVAVGTEEGSQSLESEVQAADEIEIIDMPVQ